MALAAAAGVEVFATGGIGGVHRGAEVTGDISADLEALAAHPVITVSAGAKAFLDLGRTLEYLETRGVPVLGWQHDWFPAFYTRSSGLAVPHRVEDAATVATVFAARTRPVGVLVAVPIPAEAELDAAAIDAALGHALEAAEASGVGGAAVTPFVLERDRRGDGRWQRPGEPGPGRAQRFGRRRDRRRRQPARSKRSASVWRTSGHSAAVIENNAVLRAKPSSPGTFDGR